MKGKILYDIRNLGFAIPGKINHPHFTLTTDSGIRDTFYTDYVQKEFGVSITRYDSRNPFIYAEFDIETEGKQLEEINNELLVFSSKHIDYVSNFLSFFWLVKDNSICIYSSLVVVPEIDGAAIMSNIKSLRYKISGALEMSVFDLDEISRVIRYYEGFAPFVAKSSSGTTHMQAKINFERNEKGEVVSATEDKVSGVKYSTYNCVERGLHFLNVARRERFPAFRIAFYVAILESIFTTDSSSVSHKVAERVAMYLEEEKDVRQNLYDFIIRVYNMRSTFLHGQKFSEDTLEREELLADVERLDEIIRAVFVMITQYDYDKFTALIPKGQSTKNMIEKRINFLKYIIFDA